VPIVAVALGSNVGDRQAHLNWASVIFKHLFADVRVSSYHETAPVGYLDQPSFLNAALVATVDEQPEALLAWMLELERERGRTRELANGPRTLDLDLILYGDVVVSQPGLTVPHPRFRTRAFVLDPLAEIAPALVDPVTGLTIDQLRHRLGATA
jgi:2-amino-4-hydroxy-6-hydroxymethyldihydropteridine diphosphokinase